MNAPNARYILSALREDMTDRPTRDLRPAELDFIREANAQHLTVLYTRNGTPFAAGNNGDGFTMRTRDYRWPFDKETTIFCLAPPR
jgi:hypothetical protein